MSDSDDTDILLLIPPDFFILDSSDVESVGHESSTAERTVVNDLISHVNQLENRIAEIERKDVSLTQLNESTCSLNSSASSNLIPSEMNPGTRRLGSTSSLNTSPSRRVTRFHSLPPTPSSSSYRSAGPSLSTYRTLGQYHLSPSQASASRSYKNVSDVGWGGSGRQKENELLSEVDLFLDGLKRDSSASRSSKERELITSGLPSSPRKRDTADGVSRLQLDEVDRLLKEVEAEQKHIEARLSSHDAPEVRRIVRKPGDDIGSVPDLGFGVRDQWKDVDRFLQSERMEAPQKQAIDEPVVSARKQYKLGDNVESIPDLGHGIRDAWVSPSGQSEPPMVPETNKEVTGELPFNSRTVAPLQSESEILPKQTPKVFSSRRKLDLDPHAKPKNTFEDIVDHGTVTSLDSFPSSMGQTRALRNKRNVNQLSISGTEREDMSAPKSLTSLAELWSDGELPAAKNTGETKLLQKYEEEKCRRQHCEQLVQALQTKLLESQQKLAVALQVDCEKDAAIAKLQGAWNSLVEHWRSVEDQRHSLSKQLQDHRVKSDQQMKQMHEKLERYEIELSKALDLAHGYKEQNENAEHIHRSQMEQLANKAQELERRLAAATHNFTKAQEREETLQKQIKEDHVKLVQLQAAMDAAAKALTSHETDLAVLSEEKEALQTRLKEEKARLDTQQQSRDKMRIELEESKKRERALQNDLKRQSEQLETVKTELHDFYQAQLERVVREKLKEFQGQLDAAESTLHRELESRERSVAQLAARQLQHVTEKHKLEVSLLDQKHSEELRLLQLQLTKASRQIQELEGRLSAYEKRSSSLAERLHGVMENQWREALNIISNQSDNKSQSEPVKFEKPGLGPSSKGNDTAWMLVQQQQKSQSLGSSHSSADDVPFGRDGQVTHRTASPIPQQQPNQTEENDELKRYIKMLLERAPGNPIGSPPDQFKAPPVAKASGSVSSTSQMKPPWK